MRASFQSLMVLAVVLAGCQRSTPVTPLCVYVVSQEKVENGQFIDTPDFAKLGYIGPNPDLTITSLVMVEPLSITETEAAGPQAGIKITMRSNDAQKFAALSRSTIDKKILLMIGDMPLTAATVTTEMRGEVQGLQFTCPSKAVQAKIANELTKLTR